jgi:hypothetical protein
VSDLLCMIDPVHASSKGSMHDDLQGTVSGIRSGLNNSQRVDFVSQRVFWMSPELQDLVGFGPEPCNFGSSDEAQIPRPRTGRSLASAPDRHDRHAPRTGEAGGADRLGVLRDGVGRVLPVAHRAPGDVAAAGGGLLYLQHTYRLSDEAVVARWVENPYLPALSVARRSFSTASRSIPRR